MANPRSTPRNELVDAILDAANVLMRVAARSVIDVEDEVSSPQLRVLVFIAREGAQSSGAIAQELQVHPSNATRISDRLIRIGLLTKAEGTADRRYVNLTLTDEGRKLVARVFRHRRAAIARVIGSVPPEQASAMLEAFRTFATAAQETGETDGRFTLSVP